MTVGITALSLGMLWLAPGPKRASSSDGLPVASVPIRARPTKTLYKELCSLCHGETGAGDGPTELQRPARSFVAGGYSYGNSLAMVMRTLEYGIPGSAMPAFGETLSLQERTALAGYVLSLGPKPRTVSTTAGDLTAAPRPTVVQGAMQDPSTGAIEPRSLLIGFPNGTSVQYRTQDLAVVALYRADPDQAFARRTDWRGMGGSALRALADQSWTLPGSADRPGAAVATHENTNGQPLARHLRSTRIEPDRVILGFEFRDASGVALGTGAETLRCIDGGTVARTIEITPGSTQIQRTRAAGSQVPASSQATASTPLPGLLMVDPKNDATTRHLVHANDWSSSLQAIL